MIDIPQLPGPNAQGRASPRAHAAPGTDAALTHNLGFARNTDLESRTNPQGYRRAQCLAPLRLYTSAAP